jgi:hypothetical protein
MIRILHELAIMSSAHFGLCKPLIPFRIIVDRIVVLLWERASERALGRQSGEGSERGHRVAFGKPLIPFRNGGAQCGRG